jgi:preprotein translocase subunit SecG
MEVVTWIIRVILWLVSIGLIIIVLLQKGKEGGISAITGGDSFAMKGKAKGKDALLQKLTKIAAIAFMVLAVALAVITKFFLK